MTCVFVLISTPNDTLSEAAFLRLVVQERRKGQVVSIPEINKEKARETSSLSNLVTSPLSTKPIEWPPTGPPSERYPLGAPPGRPLSRPTPTFSPKSSEECDPPGDGHKRWETVHSCHRGTPSVSWQSGTVSDLGSHRTILGTKCTTMVRVPGSSEDAEFHHESQEDEDIKIKQKTGEPLEDRSPVTKEVKNKGSKDRPGLGRGPG